MFTASKNQTITTDIVQDAIDYNDSFRGHYNKLEKYYRGQHDVLYRDKPETLSNQKIVINHAKYITDMNVGYMLGNPIEYQTEKGINIDPVLDQYTKQTISDLDHEIAKDTSIFGKQTEYTFAVGNDLVSKNVDVRNCVVVYDDTVEHSKMFAVIYKHGEQKDTFDYVTVVDSTHIYDYVVGKKLGLASKKPHAFGAVPVVEYFNNSESMGDFEDVISLIDAYNILQSDRINDKEQLVGAILAAFGFDITEDQLTEIMESRTMSNIPVEAKLMYLVKELNEDKIDILRKSIESDIHKISKTPNMSDENFVGNSSGVAIRYKILPFEQNVKNKERYLEKGLKERFQLYVNYLSKLRAMSNVEVYKVDAVFKHNLPQNDLETSQMIMNLRGDIDSETLISQLSFIRNAKEVIEAARQEALSRVNLELPNFGTGEPNDNEDNEDQNDDE